MSNKINITENIKIFYRGIYSDAILSHSNIFNVMAQRGAIIVSEDLSLLDAKLLVTWLQHYIGEAETKLAETERYV